MSIRSASDIWAVGNNFGNTSIVHWNGTTWSTVPSPNPGVGGRVLNGVSAISGSNAWAVGSYVEPSGQTRTLTMRWDGTAWGVVVSPSSGQHVFNTLRAVSARADNDAWAVGSFSNSSSGIPAAMHWNGSAWSLASLQNPGVDSELYAVHTHASNDAWAVGTAGNQPLFYHWNGSTWRGQIGGQGLRPGALHGVAAVAANDVWAVGVPVDGGGTQPRPWVLRYNGQFWREDTSIPQEVDPVQLYGVSASSPTNVWVVGRTAGQIVRYRWDGSSWTRFSSPDPSLQDQRHLLGVGTIGVNDAWAVGFTEVGSSTQTYIERFSNICPPPTSTRTATPVGTRTPTATPNSYIVIPRTGTIVPGTRDVGNHCDNCTTRLSLPFATTLYDRKFSAAVVGSNGTLGFITNNNPPSNNCLPDTAFDYGILPYWDDLDTSSRTACNGPCGIYTSTSGAAPARIFNIEWRATLRGASRLVNFEVRLYEAENRIDLIYGSLDPASSHTIGAQRDTGSFVTRISCNVRFGPGSEPAPEGPNDWEVRPGIMLSLVQPEGEPTPTPTACPIQFSDVPPDHTFYPFVRCLACRGILGGYDDGTFRPGNDVTRGQIAKIVSNASGFIEPVEGQTFSDVPPDHTFYQYVERIAIRGIISGYDDGTFRPQNNATRGQISKIVANTASFTEPVEGQTFSDVPPDHTFYQYIERMASRGIISGYADGTFRPQNNATRGQTAKIIANTFFPGCSTP